MKFLMAILGIFLATSATAQSIKIIDSIPKANVGYGNRRELNQFLSTDSGQISALFEWQNLTLFIAPKSSLVLTRTEVCLNGGRKSYWAVLKGSVSIKARKFSNPCSAAYFDTARGTTKLIGTELSIQAQEDDDIVGVAKGSVIFSNQFGSLPINQGQYGTVKTGEAMKGPFTVDFRHIAYRQVERSVWELYPGSGYKLDGTKITAPNGESRNCKLLPHGYLKCS